MVLFWVLNLAGVLVSMGMEMEMEMEKRGHPLGWWIVWMDGCLAWLRDTLGLCFGLSSVELELDFTFCDERGGDERCRF
jgi:hypothetical protein